MIGLNKIGLNQVQLNQLYLNTLCTGQKSSRGDGFPRLRGDVTRWSFKGLTNEQMSKSPRLEDADHKGRFLTFRNFSWSGMSGCGGYLPSKEIFSYTPAVYSLNFTDPDKGIKEFDVYFQLIGLDENSGVSFNLDIRESGTAKRIKRETYTKDGIYHFEYKSEDDATNLYMIGYNGVDADKTTFTVKILPYYPGFIIGDGVDDCAVTEKDLDFEDTYTVYTAFIPFQEDPARNMVLCGKNNTKDFYMNYSTLNSINFYSSSKAATVLLSNGFNLIICKRTTDKMIIKNLLTNVSVEIDANAVSENPGLYYLWRSLNNASSYAKAAIAGQVICNGHFTTDEEDTKVLNWYKKEYPWLFFDQAWTVTGKSNEDTDRATIANITGNGNNLVLSNFGFAGNSGYGEYAENWSPWRINKVDSTKSNIYHNRMEITLPAIGDSSRTQCNFYSPLCEVGTIYDFSFKISGLTDNSAVFVKPGTNGGGAIIAQYNKDGVYHLNYTLTDEAIIDESTQNRIYFFVQNFSDEEMNLTVEQIPNHEGYLVTDGVDDKVYSSAFTLGNKFTVVGEWELLDTGTALSGLAKNVDFFLFSNINGLSFYCKQGNTATVFNGIKSLTAFNSEGLAYDHKWKEYVDKKTGNEAPRTTSFVIGTGNNTYSKVALKNIAMYAGKVLSKEDTIKAYIYLQTLKAK